MHFNDFECTSTDVVNVALALLTQDNDLFDRDCMEPIPVYFPPPKAPNFQLVWTIHGYSKRALLSHAEHAILLFV